MYETPVREALLASESSEAAGAAPFQIRMKPFLGGPNLYAPHSALVLETQFEEPLGRLLAPIGNGPAVLDALQAVHDGRELTELLARALESTAGKPASELMTELACGLQEPFVVTSARGRAVASGEFTLNVLLPAEDSQTGVAAWDLAARMVLAVRREPGADRDELNELVVLHRKFSDMASRRSAGQMGLAIARAARRLDIPFYRPDPMGLTLQLGQGHRRRLYYSTLVEPISHLSANLAHDKLATLRILQKSGLPVLKAMQVSSEEDAIAAAARIGHPVVIKPVDGSQGAGVSVGLTSDQQFREAYRLAARSGSLVMVERFAPGDDHRLLVVEGKLIAAARRIPAHVTGNGRSTIAALIEELNTDPRRGDGHAKVMNKVKVDWRLTDVLERQSLTLDSIPPPGRVVLLSLAGNISQGGTAVDVTNAVHPDNREAAERAAIQIGLDVVGVDFISPDIAKSWRLGEGWILELNAPAGLRPHWIANPDQDVTTPIIRHMYPQGSEARIPTAGVTGSMGKTTTCQMLAGMGRAAGKTVGLSTTQGVWSGGFRVAAADWSSGAAAVSLLTDPTVELGIFEFARGGLNKWGMSIDGVDVACVLNVFDNHVGLDGIHSREQMAALKSIIVRHARRAVVLNAEDPLVLGMRRLTQVPVTLVAFDEEHPEITAHRQAGGCIVVTEEIDGKATIRLVDKRRTVLELPVGDIPAARQGRSRSVTVNAMFAIAVAHNLGLSGKDIRVGLAGFASTFEQNPGRHNWITGFPFELILNWTDGSVALADVIETSDLEPTTGKRRIMLTVPGNRSDEWIRNLGRTAAGHFDRYHCAEMENHLRGREPGTVPALIAEGLRERGVPEQAIAQGDSQADSIVAILTEARPGDRVILATYDGNSGLQAIEQVKVKLDAMP